MITFKTETSEISVEYCALLRLQCGRPGFNPWLGKSRWRRARLPTPEFLGFPCGLAGKESACNARDLGSIPGLGRSPGEGKGYPIQYSGLENSMDYPWNCKESEWLSNFPFHFLGVSHVAQWWRIHLPMQETWVQSLDQEDPLEKEMATHSNILAWRIPWTEEPSGLYSPWGHKDFLVIKQQQACTFLRAFVLVVLAAWNALSYDIYTSSFLTSLTTTKRPSLI